MQSKHDVMKNIDDVSTLMMLTSLYLSNKKKLGLKLSKFFVFLGVQYLYRCTNYAIATNSHIL